MKHLLMGLCIVTFAATVRAQSADAVLARMDRQAPLFHAMLADVKMSEYTTVLDSKTEEAGTLQMQRLKARDLRAILTFKDRTIAFQGKNVLFYFPKLKTYEEYPAKKLGNALNQFLLLGFGSSGKELAQSYIIKYLGQEKVAGQDTSKLLLDPKDAAVREKLQKIEIWVPNDSANPVQQQFYEPSGNYRRLTYTGIDLKPPIKGTLEFQLPPGTARQQQ